MSFTDNRYIVKSPYEYGTLSSSTVGNASFVRICSTVSNTTVTLKNAVGDTTGSVLIGTAGDSIVIEKDVNETLTTNQNVYATGEGDGGDLTVAYVTSGLQFNLQTAPTSGSTWTDTSGNSRNATLVGSPSYVSINGGGIRLNNQDGNGTDYISVPYNIASNPINISSTVTVEVIASFNPTSFWGAIWGNEIFDISAGYVAYVDSSTNISYGTPYNETSVTITASNAIRQWIFVINGTQGSLYLNGSQVGTTGTISNQTIFATSEFYFGARHSNDGTGLTDTMNNSDSALYPVFYQMRVYNKALSGAEITQNYNAVKDTYGLLPSGYVTLAGLTWAPMTTGGTYAQSQTYAANFTGLGFPAGTWRSATVAELQSLTQVLSYADAQSIYGWAFSSHAFNIWSSESGRVVNFATGASPGTSNTNNFNFLVCKTP